MKKFLGDPQRHPIVELPLLSKVERQILQSRPFLNPKSIPYLALSELVLYLHLLLIFFQTMDMSKHALEEL